MSESETDPMIVARQALEEIGRHRRMCALIWIATAGAFFIVAGLAITFAIIVPR